MYKRQNQDIPFGQEVFVTSNGCDSIVNIDLIYNEATLEEIFHEGCEGDGFEVFVNGVLYDENNSTGQEILLNSSLCDSIVFIDLNYLRSDCDFYVPNIISLGSEDLNNKFGVYFHPECAPESLLVLLYDRWGNLIYKSNDITFKWSGLLHNNKINTGVYTYRISLQNKEGQKHLAGDLIVID